MTPEKEKEKVKELIKKGKSMGEIVRIIENEKAWSVDALFGNLRKKKP